MRTLPSDSLVALVLLSAVFLQPGCAGGRDHPPGRRPNILFLFADDQRADTIAAWGNSHIRTPNLDRLVRQGYSFRNNYNMGGNSGAVCIPSRAMVNSGKAYFRIRNDLEGVRILPEILRANGYVTFATGKWHNKRPSWLRGFERGKAVFFGGMANHLKVPLEDLLPDGTLGNDRTGGFSSEVFADAAIEFLRTYDGDKPFYAYVAFTAPHDPRMPPMKYREMYYQERPLLPRNFMPQHPFNLGPTLTLRDEQLAPWPRTKEVVSDQLAEYYGMITHLDEQIGRVLQSTRRTLTSSTPPTTAWPSAATACSASRASTSTARSVRSSSSVRTFPRASPLLRSPTSTTSSLPCSRWPAYRCPTTSTAGISRPSGAARRSPCVIPSSSPTKSGCARCGTGATN